MEEPKLNIEDTITITYKGEIYSEEDLNVIYDILAEEYYKNNEQNLRDDIDFKPIWLRKSVLFKIGSFRINLLQLCGVCRRSGRVVECTGLENRRR